MEKNPLNKEELEQKDLLDLLKLLTDAKRLQKARTIKYKDIQIVFQSADGFMYHIKGSTQSYFLRIDRKNRVLVHNCEDWQRRGLRDGILCKHFIRIFQEIYEKEAKAILIDVLLTSWAFTDSDEYLKK